MWQQQLNLARPLRRQSRENVLQAGIRIMSLIQSARINGHDPYAYLKDVLTRLSTQWASEIEQLLPHEWVSA